MLFCSPVGHDVPALMADKVIDGTSCGPYESDLCIKGSCKVRINMTALFCAADEDMGKISNVFSYPMMNNVPEFQTVGVIIQCHCMCMFNPHYLKPQVKLSVMISEITNRFLAKLQTSNLTKYNS